MDKKNLKYPLPTTVKNKNDFYLDTGIWVPGNNWTDKEIEEYQKWKQQIEDNKKLEAAIKRLEQLKRKIILNHHNIPTCDYTPYVGTFTYAPLTNTDYKHIGYDENNRSITQKRSCVFPFAYIIKTKTGYTLSYNWYLMCDVKSLTECKVIDYSSEWWDTEDGKLTYIKLYNPHEDLNSSINRNIECFQEITGIKSLNNELFNISTHEKRVEMIGDLYFAKVFFNEEFETHKQNEDDLY